MKSSRRGGLPVVQIHPGGVFLARYQGECAVCRGRFMKLHYAMQNRYEQTHARVTGDIARCWNGQGTTRRLESPLRWTLGAAQREEQDGWPQRTGTSLQPRRADRRDLSVSWGADKTPQAPLKRSPTGEPSEQHVWVRWIASKRV
jgi:hypothetical protein